MRDLTIDRITLCNRKVIDTLRLGRKALGQPLMTLSLYNNIMVVRARFMRLETASSFAGVEHD